MNDEQIDEMKAALLLGKRLFWLHFEEMKEIGSVVPYIESEDEDESEPGPCAMLLNGGWIALWNVEASTIYVFEPLFKTN